MVQKIFTYRGKTLEQLKKMSLQEFAQLLPSARRRIFRRGFSDAQKRFMKRFEKKGNGIKTHCREMVILPSMIGKTIYVYKGKEYVPVAIQEEMIGMLLGEFVPTRTRVAHSAPGIGATRSSAHVSQR